MHLTHKAAVGRGGEANTRKRTKKGPCCKEWANVVLPSLFPLLFPVYATCAVPRSHRLTERVIHGFPNFLTLAEFHYQGVVGQSTVNDLKMILRNRTYRRGVRTCNVVFSLKMEKEEVNYCNC